VGGEEVLQHAEEEEDDGYGGFGGYGGGRRYGGRSVGSRSFGGSRGEGSSAVLDALLMAQHSLALLVRKRGVCGAAIQKGHVVLLLNWCRGAHLKSHGAMLKRLRCRVVQNRIYAPYMTVNLVIFLPRLPYIHCIYMVLANPVMLLTAYS